MTYLFENTADNTFWNTEDNEWYGERGIRPNRRPRRPRKPVLPLAAPAAPYPGIRPYMYDSYFDMITSPTHKAIFDAYELAGVPISAAAFETPYLSVDYSDMKYQPPLMRMWAPPVFPPREIERAWVSRFDNSYWRGGDNVHWGEAGMEGEWTLHLDDDDYECYDQYY